MKKNNKEPAKAIVPSIVIKNMRKMETLFDKSNIFFDLIRPDTGGYYLVKISSKSYFDKEYEEENFVYARLDGSYFDIDSFFKHKNIKRRLNIEEYLIVTKHSESQILASILTSIGYEVYFGRYLRSEKYADINDEELDIKKDRTIESEYVSYSAEIANKVFYHDEEFDELLGAEEFYQDTPIKKIAKGKISFHVADP